MGRLPYTHRKQDLRIGYFGYLRVLKHLQRSLSWVNRACGQVLASSSRRKGLQSESRGLTSNTTNIGVCQAGSHNRSVQRPK